MTTKERKVVLWIILVATVASVTCRYFLQKHFDSLLQKQLHNIQLADEYAAVLREQFKDDSHFQNIEFHSYTSGGGCLKVSGYIQNEADIHFITNAIESAKPPVGIYFELNDTNQFIRFAWFDRNSEPPLLEKN